MDKMDKRIMKFRCRDCGRVFDKEIDSKLADILLDIQEANGSQILESVCEEKNKCHERYSLTQMV